MSNFNDEVCEYNSTPVTENFGYGFGFGKGQCTYPEIGTRNDFEWNYSDRCWIRNSGQNAWPCKNYGKDFADVVHYTPVTLNGVKENNYLWDGDDIRTAFIKGKEKIFEAKCNN